MPCQLFQNVLNTYLYRFIKFNLTQLHLATGYFKIKTNSAQLSGAWAWAELGKQIFLYLSMIFFNMVSTFDRIPEPATYAKYMMFDAK